MRRLCLIAVCLGLAACQEQGASVEPDAPDTCGKAQYADLMGATRAEVDARSIPQPLRILGEGDAMTMDYRADRLNISLNDKERVVRIWCG